MLRRLVLVSSLIFMSSWGYAGSFDVRLGDEAAQFEYLFDNDAQIGIGGTDVSAALFFNENDDIALTVGAIVTGNSTGKNRALQFGAGVSAYGAELDTAVGADETIASLAIGGRASYIFPSSTPMAVSLEVFYAPDITSFGDNEDLLDAQIRFELEVAPSTRIYVGYRKLEAELETSGVEYQLDDSGHLGLRFSF
jgi:hypothetical protein